RRPGRRPRRPGTSPPPETGSRLAPCRPAPAHQATGDRQAPGGAPRAEGHRPGRPPREGRPGEVGDGRAEVVHSSLVRRGGVAQEDPGASEIATVSRRAAAPGACSAAAAAIPSTPAALFPWSPRSGKGLTMSSPPRGSRLLGSALVLVLCLLCPA